MKKILVMLLVYTALVFLNGCGPWQLTECIEMTDGAEIGRHFDRWQRNDERIRADFKPQIKSWWTDEKKRWPKFRRTCPNAADFYAESMELAERQNRRVDADTAYREVEAEAEAK